jgi:hypothetical protein
LIEQHESDALFAEIGRVVVRWAELEEAIGVLVTALLDDYQRYTRIVSAELGYRGKIDLCTSLYLERHGEDSEYPPLKRIFSEISKLAEQRNGIVHAIWRGTGTPVRVTRIKTTAKQRRGFNTAIRNYDLDEFRNLSDQMREVQRSLLAFTEELVREGKGFSKPVGENV